MKKVLFFIILSVFTAVFGFSQSQLSPVATVNLIRTEPITVSQHRTEVQRLEAQMGRTMTQSERRQVLDALINERLVLQAAERDRITVTDNEINQQFQQLRAQLAQNIGRQPTDAEFAQAIRNEFGMDEAAFREQFRKQLITQKYLMAKKGTLLNSVKEPTDAEISAEYNLVKTQLVRPQTVRVSMILVPYGPDAASRTSARQLADRLIREIGTNPSAFDEAVARSAAPNSGYQAGDVGYVPRNQEARAVFGQAFIDVAFSLNQGQVSRLIEGAQGFQIIKVSENLSEKTLELNDPIEPGIRMTVKEYLTGMMLSQRQQDVLTQATNEIVTELRSGGRTFTVNEANLNW